MFIDQRQFSLQEAWDIGTAILACLDQAELSHPFVRACIEDGGPAAQIKAGCRLREENQEDHNRQRAAHGEVARWRSKGRSDTEGGVYLRLTECMLYV